MPMNHRFATLGAAAIFAAALVSGCGTPAMSSSSANAGSAPHAAADTKIQVVASFYPMADFAQKVGGDLVEVKNLVPAGTEPHEWEPSPQDITAIEGSDLFVYNGADMEGWVEDALASVDTSKTQVVEASDGIELRVADHDHDADDAETEERGEEDGHDHAGEHDPHVWLSPKNAKKELENIKDGLVKADPDHKADYEANYARYAREFEALDREYTEDLAPAASKTIVVSHEAYGYLCDEFGLTQLPIAGMDAEGEPDAKTMAEIVDFVKKNNIKTIFSEDLVSPKVAQQIADESGATCVQLSPVEGLTDEQLKAGEDYLSVMRDNLDKLIVALNKK